MKSWKTPTPDQVDQAVAQLAQPAHYRYFFDRLQNPQWLIPLNEKGFLRKPPQSIQTPIDGGVSYQFPPWPDSSYLARMALLGEEFAETIKNIILKMEFTDNWRVHDDLAEATLALPPHMIVEVLPKVREWLSNTEFQRHLASVYGSIMSRLAVGGQAKAALEFARIVLEIRAGPIRLINPLPAEATELERELHAMQELPPEPVSQFDEWHYREIIQKNVPDLLEAEGIETLKLLCSLLNSAISYSLRADEGGPETDFSYIWRHAVEDHEQDLLNQYKLKSVLVSAIRDSAVTLIQKSRLSVEVILELFADYSRAIFKRIRMHLLRLFAKPTDGPLRACLLDFDVYRNPYYRHEHVLLLRERFRFLLPEDQQSILDWMSRGPDPEEFKQFYEKARGEIPSEEIIQRDSRRWRRDKYSYIANDLPANLRAEYDALVREFGPSEHPEFVIWSSSWTGPTSPLGGPDIVQMGVEELLAYLRVWQPQGGGMNPSAEGLGRVIQGCVAGNPEAYAVQAESFRDLEPTYIRGFLSGFSDAAQLGKSFSWKPVLALCRWVVEQSRDIPGRNPNARDMEKDPHWGWARKQVADFMDKALNPQRALIPFEARMTAWNVLEPLTHDPDPTQADEAIYGGSNMNPSNYSINTVRGQAMHAVIHYALWVYVNIEKMQGGKERLENEGFDLMPEVRRVLQDHLHPDADPSEAVRAVYGWWFPQLELLDHKWTETNVERIFPNESEQESLWRAAWESYVVFCQPFERPFELLIEQYRRAIGSIGVPSVNARYARDPNFHLTEHLMEVYWRGKISLSEEGGLLPYFYAKATDETRRDAIVAIGRHLGHRLFGAAHVERLKILWEARLAEFRQNPSAHRREAEAFGWWFADYGNLEGMAHDDAAQCAVIDDAWALAQLESVLRMFGKTDMQWEVVKRLAKLSSSFAIQTCECLRLIIEGADGPMGIELWREEAKEILRVALTNVPETQRVAATLVNKLGAMGYSEFGDLLQLGET